MPNITGHTRLSGAMGTNAANTYRSHLAKFKTRQSHLHHAEQIQQNVRHAGDCAKQFRLARRVAGEMNPKSQGLPKWKKTGGHASRDHPLRCTTRKDQPPWPAAAAASAAAADSDAATEAADAVNDTAACEPTGLPAELPGASADATMLSQFNETST
ncbi:hypothetical protein M2432_000910 [Mycobacterium sp. OTB74]|jgi:hypothetical protein|nr:hypothetical protein [Mycobacterium sp. OTB74]